MIPVVPREPLTAARPLCPVFAECGGCAYQDLPYPQELRLKEEHVKHLIRQHISVSEDCFEMIVASPKPYRYRNRIDLNLMRTHDQKILIGFTPKSGHGVVPVDDCPIADETIGGFIPVLKDRLTTNLPPKYRRANIVVRTGDNGKVFWGGIGRRSCQLNPADYLWTEIEGKKIFYSLDTFFQANLSILPKLFQRIGAFDIWDTKPVLYDLCAGVGLFSIVLFDRLCKAVLLEESPLATKLARYNVSYHHLARSGITTGRMEDALPPLLAQESDTAPKVAVVDPPRAGLSPKALEILIHARAFHQLFYLSCNPAALARDLAGFVNAGWHIEKIMPFDFFPKTKHIETLAALIPQPRKS